MPALVREAPPIRFAQRDGGIGPTLDRRPGLERLEVAQLGDPGRRRAMSEAVRRFARPDAAARIVDRLLALAGAGEGAAA